MLFRRREKYQFTGRKHSVRGMISFILGFLVLAGFVVLSILSGLAKGNAGTYVGIIGLLLLLLSTLGIYMGVRSCKEKDIFYRYPVLGVIINGFFLVIFTILYLIGI